MLNKLTLYRIKKIKWITCISQWIAMAREGVNSAAQIQVTRDSARQRDEVGDLPETKDKNGRLFSIHNSEMKRIVRNGGDAEA